MVEGLLGRGGDYGKLKEMQEYLSQHETMHGRSCVMWLGRDVYFKGIYT